MFENERAAAAAKARPNPSLARSAELQAALAELLQRIRQAPTVLHAMDRDELRQVIKAASELHRKAHLALDVLIAVEFQSARDS